MNQRPGKTHAAALRDDVSISLIDLIRFCDLARIDLEKEGDSDAALRFEILRDNLTDGVRGKLTYNSKMLGL